MFTDKQKQLALQSAWELCQNESFYCNGEPREKKLHAIMTVLKSMIDELKNKSQ